jgi:hypothetical protein
VRPGYGIRRPGLERLLRNAVPVGFTETVWADGTLPLRVTAFFDPVDLPSEIVTSVRCFVLVHDEIVICQTPDGPWHPWPGGRREPGETYEETALREVHEETGWLLCARSLKPAFCNH